MPYDPQNLSAVKVEGGVELSCDESPTAGVESYHWFRRTVPTGQPFDPEQDAPIAQTSGTSYFDEEGEAGNEYQVFGSVPGSS